MPTLQGIIDEFTVAIRDVEGLAFVPDDPMETPPTSPFGVVYHQSGRAEHGPSGRIRYYADISIAILTNRNDMSTAHAVALPFLEPVTEKIYSKLISTTDEFDNVENLGTNIWTFGAVAWGGVDYLGYIITFSDVKFVRTI